MVTLGEVLIHYECVAGMKPWVMPWTLKRATDPHRAAFAHERRGFATIN